MRSVTFAFARSRGSSDLPLTKLTEREGTGTRYVCMDGMREKSVRGVGSRSAFSNLLLLHVFYIGTCELLCQV